MWRRIGIPVAIFAAFIAGLIALAQVGEIPDNPDEDPILTGQFEIDGSSTVGPITLAVAEEFSKLHPNVRIPVGVSGTGGGFKRFVRGETLISNASRPIKEIEAVAALENGIEYLEIPVAFDGLSVVVHPRNAFVQCLTTDELRRIWEPESAVRKWSDIRSEWPDKKIRLYGPGTDSGTFDYFTQAIVGESGASRPDYAASEDDNVLVQGIAGDKFSLGYFGYAYYAENQELLKLIDVLHQQTFGVLLKRIELAGGFAFGLANQFVQHCLGRRLVSGQRHAAVAAEGISVTSPPLGRFAFDLPARFRLGHRDRFLV